MKPKNKKMKKKSDPGYALYLGNIFFKRSNLFVLAIFVDHVVTISAKLFSILAIDFREDASSFI